MSPATKTKKPAKARAPKASTSVETKTAQEPAKKMRRFVGTVVSTAMHKTIVVKVDTMKSNPKYHKTYRSSVKYHVHDEEGKAKVGEKVSFVECRPISKTKRWRFTGVVTQA